MKAYYKVILLSALCLTMAAAAGCHIQIGTPVTESSVTEEIQTVSQQPQDNSETDGSAESTDTREESEEESADESSVPSEDSSESSTQPEESAEISEEEPSVVESSEEGYHFDDEHIVKDYHTATEYTSDPEFNAIFKDNAVDRSYTEELQNASSTNEMRSVTTSYAEKWHELSGSVYSSLYELLEDNPEARQELTDSQNNWNDSLADMESSFYEEAAEGGTGALLSADSAVLNYYKTRTAVLLNQIYQLQGSIELSAYGL